MRHSELEGVLSVMTAFAIDDSSALDELTDRIERNYAAVTNTQWGVGKRKWLNAVGAAVATLERPDVPTAEENQALVDERNELAAALQYTEDQVDEVRQKYERLKASETRDPATVRDIDVGEAPVARFNAAVYDVRVAFREVPNPVREAIYRSLSGDLAPYPNAFDDRAVEEFNDAIDRKLITEPHDDAMYGPNLNKPRVAAAARAVQHLQALLRTGEDEALNEWFSAEYPDVMADLADRDCWDELLA
jgi:hypothetical protein